MTEQEIAAKGVEYDKRMKLTNTTLIEGMVIHTAIINIFIKPALESVFAAYAHNGLTPPFINVRREVWAKSREGGDDEKYWAWGLMRTVQYHCKSLHKDGVFSSDHKMWYPPRSIEQVSVTWPLGFEDDIDEFHKSTHLNVHVREGSY